MVGDSRVKKWLFTLGLCWALPVLAANKIESVRIWPSPDSTRIVFDVKEAPRFHVVTAQGRELQLELDDVASVSLGKLSGEADLIKDITVKRSPQKGKVLVTISLTMNAKANAFKLPPMDRYGHRLVLDIEDSAAQAAANAPVKTLPTSSARPIIIAIDAGHGGHDPGAIGPKGTYEKQVTLAIAQKVQALLNKEPGFKAVMTRTSDYYIYPSKRPDVARKHQADLLVSIHADAAENRKASGASVWVLSLKRATTEVGRMMEKTEQHSELLGGVGEAMKDSSNEKYLAQTFLDLSMNHSMSTGFDIAKLVLNQLDDVTKLHKKEPQAASLGVLKAPDIPSILVETGYISNHAEEQKLKSTSHQHKLARAIADAVKAHYVQSPPPDSWLAQRYNKSSAPSVATKPDLSKAVASNQNTQSIRMPSKTEKRHVVKAGESLSRLASQYGVPMSVLRQHNRLASDQIRIGQVLRIP